MKPGVHNFYLKVHVHVFPLNSTSVKFPGFKPAWWVPLVSADSLRICWVFIIKHAHYVVGCREWLCIRDIVDQLDHHRSVHHKTFLSSTTSCLHRSVSSWEHDHRFYDDDDYNSYRKCYSWTTRRGNSNRFWRISTLHKNTTIHQVTTMLATSKNVIFSGHNHLLTTGPDDLTLWLSPECLLEVATMVAAWWIVAFLHSGTLCQFRIKRVCLVYCFKCEAS